MPGFLTWEKLLSMVTVLLPLLAFMELDLVLEPDLVLWSTFDWLFCGSSLMGGLPRVRTMPPLSSTKPLNCLNSFVYLSIDISLLLSSFIWSISSLKVEGALPSFYKYRCSISSSFFANYALNWSSWTSFWFSSISRKEFLSLYYSLAALSV